jgi:restriction endonuclease S subunit
MEMLKTIPYSEFYMWDVKRLSLENLKYKYPTVFLKEILSKAKVEWEEIKDDKEYPILGVRAQGKGVYINRIAKGNELTMRKYQRSIPYSLFYCKVRTVKGQWGVVYPSFASSYGSSNMTYLNINKEKVDLEFFELLLKLKRITDNWDKNAVGADGRHFPLNTLLNLKAPLPPLEEQNRMVANYNSKIQQAKEQEEKAKQLEQEVENYLFEALGIESVQEKRVKRSLFFVNFENVGRWDVWVDAGNIKSEVYTNTTLSSIVIGKPMYGANVKGVKRRSDTRYVRITDINENGELNDEFVSPASVEEKFLLKENDFLIARSGNTVGKTLLFKEKYGRAIYAGYLVKYNIDYSKIIPEYLLLFSKSYIFKKWIESNQRVSGQPNINGQEFLYAPLVLPPLKIQAQIVSHISGLKQQIKDLYAQAKANREKAIQAFEQGIFQA